MHAAAVPCSAARANRLAELRSQATVKDREIAELEAQIAAAEKRLQSQASGGTLATAPSGDARMKGTPSALVDALCANRDAIKQIPFADVGNTVIELKAALRAEEMDHKVLEKTVAELELQRRNIMAANLELRQRIKEECDRSGFTTSALSTLVKDQSKPVPTIEENQAVRDAVAAKRRELHSANAIFAKKTRIVQQMAESLEGFDDFMRQLSQATNDFRVAERRVRAGKEVLRRVLTEHAELDMLVENASNAIDTTCRALLTHDNSLLSKRNEELVEARRADDRIVKAQELRLSVLESRLNVIEEALARQGLSAEVEARLPSLVSELDSHDSAADIAVRYCDMTHIVPQQEVVPSSIFALLAMDHEHQRRTHRRFETMLLEKRSTVKALSAKLEELNAEVFDAAQLQYELTEQQQLEIQNSLKHARELTDKHCARFGDVLKETRKVSESIEKSRPKSARTDKDAKSSPPRSSRTVSSSKAAVAPASSA